MILDYPDKPGNDIVAPGDDIAVLGNDIVAPGDDIAALSDDTTALDDGIIINSDNDIPNLISPFIKQFTRSFLTF